MIVFIEAIAKDLSQLGALHQFGIPTKQINPSTFISIKEMESIQEAEQYLISIAEKYNKENPGPTGDELIEMYNSIKDYGHLTINQVTAQIKYSK